MAEFLVSESASKPLPESPSRIFRLLSSPETVCEPCSQVETILRELDRTINDNVSSCGLVGPYALADMVLLHSLRVLGSLKYFDGQGATALMFPSNRASWRKQRETFVDRVLLCNSVRPPFSRIGGRTKTASDSYILAINTLRGILDSGERADKLREAGDTDALAEHPQPRS